MQEYNEQCRTEHFCCDFILVMQSALLERPVFEIYMRNVMNNTRKALNRAVIILSVIFMILTASVILFLLTDTAQYYHNMNLGKRYLTNREYESAVRAFDAAIRIRTEDGEAYMGRGDAYAGLGNTENAGRDFETARILDPRLDLKIERRLDDLDSVENYEISENP